MTTTTNLIELLTDAKKNNIGIGECWNLMDEAADLLAAQAKQIKTLQTKLSKTEAQFAKAVASWKTNETTQEEIIAGLQAKLSAIEAQEPVAQRLMMFDGSVFFDEDPPTEYERSIGWMPLYAAPVAPAQSVNELVEALQAYRCTETVDEEGEGLPLVDVLTHGNDIGPGLRELEFLADHLYDYAAPVAPAQPVNELVEALEDARDVLYQVAHGNTACGKDAECVGGLIATALANAKAARPLTKEQVQPAQWTAGAKMPCGAVVTNVYDAYEAGKKAALLQSNAERVPLSDEQINRLWNDSFIGADPTSGNQRFKFARAIEAEIKKGQQ